MSPRPVVLLVDDEPFILTALQRTLRREGYELLTARSAREALELLEAQHVDLLVSDSRMPGMGGIELLREIARRRRTLPCMLLTGWPEEIPAEERAQLQIAALLPKPWDDAELKRTLRAHLAGGA